MTPPPRIAFFRPDDERSAQARELLRERGFEPVGDPMLAVEPTGASPRQDGDFTILTSRTGVRIIENPVAQLAGTRVCAIGHATANVLEEAGVTVDIVPDEFTSDGLVDRLRDHVAGKRVEIARSDHGSERLIGGLIDAGAYVHETILYELVRPEGSGASVDLLLEGSLDALLFTSSLTVEHFLEAADERAGSNDIREYLDDVTVGAIGPPTRDTALARDIPVDVMASRASFETLVDEVIAAMESDDPTTAVY